MTPERRVELLTLCQAYCVIRGEKPLLSVTSQEVRESLRELAKFSELAGKPATEDEFMQLYARLFGEVTQIVRRVEENPKE
jgi:hypothetical protein